MSPKPVVTSSTVRKPRIRHCKTASSQSAPRSQTLPLARLNRRDQSFGPSAERMRADRKRLRCFTLEIRAREIEVLVQRGLLEPDARNEPYEVAMALYRHLDKTLRA
jgi:hypothetical protein